MRAVDVLTSVTELGVRVLGKRPPIETAKWYTRRATKLGTTFIKLGQLASTRSEVFPPEVVEELGKLRETVEPMDVGIVRSELSKANIPLEIDPIPLGSASIGQVHAVISDDNRANLVVKVQRPDARQQVEEDINVLNQVGIVIGWIPQYSEISELIGEWGPTILDEMDYIEEANRMTEFSKLYSDLPVRVPRVVRTWSTPNILCMEKLDGYRLNDLPKAFIPKNLAARLLKLQLQQVIEGGLVHCDPHPGNLAFTKSGDVIYYDFGMMTRVEAPRESLVALLLSVYRNDVDGIIQGLFDIDMIVLNGRGDKSTLRPFIRMILLYIENGELSKEMLYLEGERPFRLTSKWSFLLRSFFIVEGLCKSLYPESSLDDVLIPYAQELAEDSNIRGEYVGNLSSMPTRMRMVQGAVNESLDTGTGMRIKLGEVSRELGSLKLLAWIVILLLVIEK